MILRLAHNAVTAKLFDADRDVKLEVSRLLSYSVDGAEFMQAFKSHRWDGRSSFFDFNSGTFPAGFVTMIHSELTRQGHTVKIVRNPFPAPLGPVMPEVDSFGYDPIYDYQPDVMNRLIKYGAMIAQVATGGGKSRIAKLCYARLQRPTLFLTTRGILMHQMKDSFAHICKKVGVLGDGEWDLSREANVGMVQTLVARLKETSLEDEIESLLKGKQQADEAIIRQAQAKLAKKQALRAQTIQALQLFEFVIGEEAHEASGNSYFEILRHCKNAHYRLALTATPFMKDDEESNMRLMAAFGPVGIKITEKLLIDRGILATPYFKYIRPACPPKLYRSTPWTRAYTLGILESDVRNKAILFEALRGVKHYGLKVMILVQRKEHGRLLQQMIAERGVDCEFIFGENDQAERQGALNRLKSGAVQVLIGSTILDVGVDVPAVGMVILAGGGKAEVALRQRIGRGLRAKKDGPNVCLVVDFMDDMNNHLRSHSLQRHAIVQATPGFAEHILADGADFDFEGLGLNRRNAA